VDNLFTIAASLNEQVVPVRFFFREECLDFSLRDFRRDVIPVVLVRICQNIDCCQIDSIEI
jgi:hypothetical protein